MKEQDAGARGGEGMRASRAGTGACPRLGGRRGCELAWRARSALHVWERAPSPGRHGEGREANLETGHMKDGPTPPRRSFPWLLSSWRRLFGFGTSLSATCLDCRFKTTREKTPWRYLRAEGAELGGDRLSRMAPGGCPGSRLRGRALPVPCPGRSPGTEGYCVRHSGCWPRAPGW